MLKKTIDFLNVIEGHVLRTSEIHWSTESKPIHEVTEKMVGELHSLVDKIAEFAMGITGNRIGIGDLKPMLPNAKNVTSLLNELTSDVLDYKSKLDDKEWAGMRNIIDGLLETIGSWKYLKTFK